MDQNLFLFLPTNVYLDFARNPKNKKIVALWARRVILGNWLQLYLISILVNLSCELGQIITRYDFMDVKPVIWINVRAPFGLMLEINSN